LGLGAANIKIRAGCQPKRNRVEGHIETLVELNDLDVACVFGDFVHAVIPPFRRWHHRQRLSLIVTGDLKAPTVPAKCTQIVLAR